MPNDVMEDEKYLKTCNIITGRQLGWDSLWGRGSLETFVPGESFLG